MKSTRWSALRLAVAFSLGLVVAFALVQMSRRPSTDRPWAPDHAVQPRVTFDGDGVVVDSVRDFVHGAASGVSDGSFEERYRSEAFDLSEVRSVWFVLAPFTGAWSGLAHVFVSFELEGGRFLAVSVEARREIGEEYSIKGGLMRQFEMTYVVGTEADLLGLRALRGDILYLYPSNATPEQARAMIVDMLGRAEALRSAPEFYNTLTSNCATNLRNHVNGVIEDRIPFGWGILFPGNSDKIALERGLLATDLPLEAARERYRVDERARAALAEGAEDFSVRIRR